MAPGDRDDLLVSLLQRLRAKGLVLGVAELIAARAALASGIGEGRERAVARTLRLLWCTSPAQNAELDCQFYLLLAETADRADLEPPPVDESEPASAPPPDAAEPPRPAAPDDALPPPNPAPTIAPLPVRAPQTPAPDTAAQDLILFDPVSRRAMAHSWRHLRRPVPDGAWDRVDLDATVERSARLGWHLGPAHARHETDHGHLVLLVDQGGSMVPFHRLTRDLVQTAADSALRVDIGWFQNVPGEDVYADPHRTRRRPLDSLLADCTAETALLVVSDAGAARGTLSPRRFAETARMLIRLRQRGSTLAWLNPVPADRWPGTTAGLIKAVAPMFAMDEDGLANAIDVLRGQAAGGAP